MPIPLIDNDPNINKLFKPLVVENGKDKYARSDFIAIIIYLDSIQETEEDKVYNYDYHVFVNYCLEKLNLPQRKDSKSPLNNFLEFFNDAIDNRGWVEKLKKKKDISDSDKNSMIYRINRRYETSETRKRFRQNQEKKMKHTEGYIKVEPKDLNNDTEYYILEYQDGMSKIGKYLGLVTKGGGIDPRGYLGINTNYQTQTKTYRFEEGYFDSVKGFYMKDNVAADLENKDVADTPDLETNGEKVGGKRRKNKKSTKKSNKHKNPKKSKRRRTLKKSKRRRSL